MMIEMGAKQSMVLVGATRYELGDPCKVEKKDWEEWCKSMDQINLQISTILSKYAGWWCSVEVLASFFFKRFMVDDK